MTALVVLSVLAAAGWVAVSKVTGASPARTQQAEAADGSVRADFNNDGVADLAIGTPGESVGTVAAAGAVNVQYGSATGLTTRAGQLFTQGVGSAPEEGDFFGAGLATGDFNNDGFPDLAVGAPGEDAGAVPDVGAVTVLYGSASGLTTTGTQFFTQIGSAAENGDEFGFALSAGDFNNDGFDDLAAAAPFEDAGPIAEAGAVSVLYGSAGRLTTTGARLFTELGSPVEADDTFGFALATGDFDNDGFDDLAAGAPFEDGALPDSGAFVELNGSAAGLTTSSARLLTQTGSAAEAGDSFGFALAAGDFNNDGGSDLAVGAPGEGVGSITAAGSVNAYYGTSAGVTTAGSQLFTQVGSAPEVDDSFGFALATGDFDGNGFSDLAVGAPFEDAGAVRDAGAVSVLYGSASRLSTTGGQLFTQTGSAPETADLFGFALATGNFTGGAFPNLAVGAPNEAVGPIPAGGAVSVLTGSASGLTRAGQILTQDSPNVASFVEPGDSFGTNLMGSDPAPGTVSGVASPAGGGTSSAGTSSTGARVRIAR